MATLTAPLLHRLLHKFHAEIDAGSVKTIPWEQVRREAFRRYGLSEE